MNNYQHYYYENEQDDDETYAEFDHEKNDENEDDEIEIVSNLKHSAIN